MEKLKNLPLSTHWKIHLILLGAGIFVGLVFGQLFSATILGGIFMNVGFAVMIAGIVWQILFLKCPHCGYHFHLRRPLSNFCPDCGKAIR